jgi:hypothetical protein
MGNNEKPELGVMKSLSPVDYKKALSRIPGHTFIIIMREKEQT